MFRGKGHRNDEAPRSKKPDQLLYVPPKAKNQDGTLMKQVTVAGDGACAASCVVGDSDRFSAGSRLENRVFHSAEHLLTHSNYDGIEQNVKSRREGCDGGYNYPRTERNRPHKRQDLRKRIEGEDKVNGFDDNMKEEIVRTAARRRYRGRKSSERHDSGQGGVVRITGSLLQKRGEPKTTVLDGTTAGTRLCKEISRSKEQPRNVRQRGLVIPSAKDTPKAETKKHSSSRTADDVGATMNKTGEAPVSTNGSSDDYLALLNKMDRLDWCEEVDRQEELNLQRQKQKEQEESKAQNERVTKNMAAAKPTLDAPSKERQDIALVKRGGLIQLPLSIQQETRESRGLRRDGRKEPTARRGRRSRNSESSYRRMPGRGGNGMDRVDMRRPSTPDYTSYLPSKPSVSPYGKLMDNCNVRYSYYSNPDICSENFVNDIPRNLAPTIFTEITEIEAQMGINGPCGSFDERTIDLDRVLRLRKQLEKLYHDAVIADVEYAFRHNLEHCMWKMAFYQPVELLRFLASSSSSQADRCQSLLLHLLEDAPQFYENFINEYEQRYGFFLTDYFRHIDEDLSKPLKPVIKSSVRQVKLALHSSQRFLIALGDLARYREQFNSPSNFGKSRSWYIKAVQLAPHNGRPYNQLALLAVYTRRKLDAIYHYTRSLAVKHPFLTATESLMSVFDDIAKKVDNCEELMRAEFEYQRLNCKGSFENVERRRRACREIWISPDGVKSSEIQDEVSIPSETELLTKPSTPELFRRCVMYFLYLTGMLYTKIGMEKFETFAVKMLVQFQELLERDDNPTSALSLIQIIMISLFIVHHTSIKEVDNDICFVLQHNAVQLSLSIFGIILKRVKDMLSSDELAQPSKELHLFLPSLHIFCQWMATPATYKLYSSLVSLDGVETERFSLDIWSTFADVCNFLESSRDKGIFKICLQDKNDDGNDEIVLPEDFYCSAFFDVFESMPVTRFVDKDMELDRGADYLRLESILVLAYYLDGRESFVFRYADEDRKFVALPRSSSPGPPLPRLAASDEEDDSQDGEKIRVSDLVNDVPLSDDARLLRMYQRSSEAKQAVLESEKCQIELEICPSYVVLDTNAFIYHLALIKKLIEAKKFVVVIPLVVLSELDGLCRSQEDETVASNSRASLNYLYDASDKGTKFLKAITSQGNLLDNFRNSHEMILSKDCNDDKILKCCLTFCDDEKKTEIRNLKDEPLLLHRNVVLLTGDRNLRIKASAENVPVRTVQSFLKWAKIS